MSWGRCPPTDAPQSHDGRGHRHFETAQMAAAYAVLYQEASYAGAHAENRPSA